METAIVSIVCIALIFMGGMTMSRNFLASVDASTQQLQHVLARDQAILKTSLTTLGSDVSGENTVYATLRNSGQIKLADFEHWDVIVQYTEHDTSARIVSWLPYVTGTPGDNQWTVNGIYINAGSLDDEVFEPGILNPSEEIVIRVRVSPRIAHHSNNQVVVSTPNGITIAVPFSRS